MTFSCSCRSPPAGCPWTPEAPRPDPHGTCAPSGTRGDPFSPLEETPTSVGPAERARLPRTAPHDPGRPNHRRARLWGHPTSESTRPLGSSCPSSDHPPAERGHTART